MKAAVKPQPESIVARRVDTKHRVTMPDLEPNSHVTIQPLDADTWIVKRHRPDRTFKMILIPVIDKLPDDPEWEKLELKAAKHSASKLPRFKE